MTSRLATVLVAATVACGDGGTDPTRVATSLGLAVAPAGARSGVPLETQPVIQLLGADGHPVAAAGVAITASVSDVAVLGTATVNTNSEGRAVFTDLGIGGLATSRSLVFTSPQLQNVSHPLTVAAGPASLLAAAGPLAQAAVVSSPVTARPAAKVTDAAGNAVAGVTVTFAVTAGGGTVSDATQVTGGDGVATVGAWTLGSVVGPNSLSAVSAGLTGSPLAFTATGLLLTPSLFRVNGGNGQSAPVGGAVPVPPSVIVTGIGGQPVPGVPVTFVVTAGAGQLTGADAVTGENGVASVGSWTLGAAGANRLSASSPGITGSPATFTATATQSGRVDAFNEPQTRAGTISALVTPRPVVRVTAGDGSFVAGIPVTFAVVSGGGSITGEAQLTDANGLATVGSWRLGPALGLNELSASTGPGYAGSPVTFRATAVNQLPTQISIHAGNGQSAIVGTAVAIRPAVRVMAGATPVQGYPISFAPSFGTVVTGGSTHTDANGVATVGSWTLASSVGTHSLEVFTSFGNVEFSATTTAATPSTLSAESESTLQGVAGGAPDMLRGVFVADQFGNRIAGVSVAFAVGSGGGSVNPTPQLTNAQGIARPVGWLLGTAVGLNTLTATVTGLPPVTLRAQSRADAPVAMVVAEGNGQTGGVRRDLPIDPSVRVRDQYGNLAHASVRFDIVSGGGSGGGTIDTDPETGLAATRWRLGTMPGPNSLRATLLATGATVTFTATAVDVVSNFNIQLRYLSSLTAAQQAAFTAAAARWSDIVLGELPNVQVTLPAGDCFDSQPVVSEMVDDVVILVEVVAIDGPGGVLGSAGPCAVRGGTFLPAMGVMQFDQADLSAMQASGELGDVILHEMAHVLGLGTIWEARGLLLSAGSAFPAFTGAAARQAYLAAGGGGTNVPVEGGGGSGTADAHWRESVFRSELMTGFIAGIPNPLSRVTIGSLADLGYGVDYGTADPFHLSTALQRLTAPPRRLREVRLSSAIVVIGGDGTIIMRRDRPR